jgi:hypothetical protein
MFLRNVIYLQVHMVLLLTSRTLTFSLPSEPQSRNSIRNRLSLSLFVIPWTINNAFLTEQVTASNQRTTLGDEPYRNTVKSSKVLSKNLTIGTKKNQENLRH